MNLALFTYFIPARSSPCRCTAPWAITACSTITVADPGDGDDRLALRDLVLKQASDKLPVELDEAATMTAPPRCSCSAWSTFR